MTKGFVDSPEWRDDFASDIFSKQFLHLEALSTKSKKFCGKITLFAIAMSVLYYFGITKNEQYLWFIPIGVIGTLFVSWYWAFVDLFDYQLKLNRIADEHANYKEELNASSTSLTGLYRLSRTQTLAWYTLMLSVQLFVALIAIGLALAFSWQTWLMSSIALGVLLVSGVFWVKLKLKQQLAETESP